MLTSSIIWGVFRSGASRQSVLTWASACFLMMGAATVDAVGLRALATKDNIDIWAVGDAGVVLRSLDGGESWITGAVGSADLCAVAARGRRVWIAASGGSLWRSADSGGTWTVSMLAGSPDLKSIQMIDELVGYVVGDGGVVLKTIDGGATWVAQSSGTTRDLNAVRFSDSAHGWASGDTGTLLATTTGGVAWNLVAVPTTENLYAVDANVEDLWVTGAHATAIRSATGGIDWDPALDLRIESLSNVSAVRFAGAGAVVLAGGGGFMRKTTDHGASWEFFRHSMVGGISALAWSADGMKGWACSGANRLVLRTLDAGATWNMPLGTSTAYSWSQRLTPQSNVSVGSTLAFNSQNPNSVFAAFGNQCFKSTDRGDSWGSMGTIPGTGSINVMIVSPLDSMLMVALAGGVVRSTNGGQSWTGTFSEPVPDTEVPLELDPDDPNRLLLIPMDGTLYVSNDFGLSFSLLSNPHFASPCDIEIIPGSHDVFVTDAAGSSSAIINRSTDGGLTFAPVLQGQILEGEYPFIAHSRLAPETMLVSILGAPGRGGLRRSTDSGATWPRTFSITSGWGLDIARDDPNVVMLGTWGGGQIAHLSFDQGTTFTSTPLASYNLSMLALDRSTFLAQQGTGVFKMSLSYTIPPAAMPTVHLLSPNGGEVWSAGRVRQIAWEATNLALARVEYRTAASEPWQLIAETEGYSDSLAWTVPQVETATASVRVSDAWDEAPEDRSDNDFTITIPTDAPLQLSDDLFLSVGPSGTNGHASRLSYRLPRAARVRLAVFAANGRLIATLVNRYQEAGRYSAGLDEIDGMASHHIGSGVYFCRLEALGMQRSVKIAVVR